LAESNVVTGFIAVLIITLAVQVQASLVVFTPPILAPVAQHDVGVSAAAVGLVMALIYVSSVPSALFSGKVIEMCSGWTADKCNSEIRIIWLTNTHVTVVTRATMCTHNMYTTIATESEN